MSLQLWALDLMLRLFTKPRLARTRTPQAMRRGLEQAIRTLPPPPRSVRFSGLGPPPPGAGGAMPPDAPESAPPRLLWATAPESDPTRLVLYFHGGAYIAGSPETHRPILAALAGAARAVVAAPDYRLAPEAPFPAAVEDALAAYAGLIADGWPAERIALAGESAGGGLALALLGEIDRLGWPRPACALIFSPFADLTLASPSLRRNARREAMLPTERIPEAVEGYLAGADPRDPRASPVFATFRAPPPPTLIQAGETEALRDDAERMAEALRRAGGEAPLELQRGAPHAYQFFAGVLPEARAALARAGAFVQRLIPPRDAA